MYTNEFCGLRIQIPEGERIPETDFQEAKQKLEDILNYASYCAETMLIKNKIIVNIPTTEEENVRHYLSVLH